MYGYQLNHRVTAITPQLNQHPRQTSRADKKKETAPIPQTCKLCGIDETPLTRYPHCHNKSAKYVCTSCKATSPTPLIGNVLKRPPMQKPEKTQCVSCGIIPLFVNTLIEDVFPEIPGGIVMEYLATHSNQLVPDEPYVSLSCKRRLCLLCYNSLDYDGTINIFTKCPCKKPHYIQ